MPNIFGNFIKIYEHRRVSNYFLTDFTDIIDASNMIAPPKKSLGIGVASFGSGNFSAGAGFGRGRKRAKI